MRRDAFHMLCCFIFSLVEVLFTLIKVKRRLTVIVFSIFSYNRSLCELRSNSEPLVCCAEKVNPTSSSINPGGSPALLPSRCGVTGLTDRIIDGEDAPLLAWPWMALLRGSG